MSADLLDSPTADALATVALELVDEAAAALGRLHDRRDHEAMHDFRVALRRLRSQLRAYRPWLGRAATRRLRRRLRRLASATNRARDAEVQLEWLEQSRKALARGERCGLVWIVKRLRESRRHAYAKARATAAADFSAIAERLRERLADRPGDTPPLSRTAAKLLVEQSADLEAGLDEIRSAADVHAIHESRIRAKRLRYLLEPLRAADAAAKPIVRTLKDLQDLLGELHDVHVLEGTLEAALDEASREKASRLRQLALSGERDELRREHRRDERLGLVTLAALARSRRDALFQDWETQWIGQRLGELFSSLRGFAATLAPEEGDATGSLPVEIERKYLLHALPDRARSAPFDEITQGWIPGTALRERLRCTRRDDGSERCFRTIKLGAGVRRIEIEEEMSRELFDEMWPLSEGCRLSKRRYRVEEGARCWEIDDFHDRELVLAEIELESADEDVVLPDWLAPFVVREVTAEPAYLNLTLATQVPVEANDESALGRAETHSLAHLLPDDRTAPPRTA